MDERRPSQPPSLHSPHRFGTMYQGKEIKSMYFRKKIKVESKDGGEKSKRFRIISTNRKRIKVENKDGGQKSITCSNKTVITGLPIRILPYSIRRKIIELHDFVSGKGQVIVRYSINEKKTRPSIGYTVSDEIIDCSDLFKELYGYFIDDRTRKLFIVYGFLNLSFSLKFSRHHLLNPFVIRIADYIPQSFSKSMFVDVFLSVDHDDSVDHDESLKQEEIEQLHESVNIDFSRRRFTNVCVSGDFTKVVRSLKPMKTLQNCEIFPNKIRNPHAPDIFLPRFNTISLSDLDSLSRISRSIELGQIKNFAEGDKTNEQGVTITPRRNILQKLVLSSDFSFEFMSFPSSFFDILQNCSTLVLSKFRFKNFFELNYFLENTRKQIPVLRVLDVGEVDYSGEPVTFKSVEEGPLFILLHENKTLEELFFRYEKSLIQWKEWYYELEENEHIYNSSDMSDDPFDPDESLGYLESRFEKPIGRKKIKHKYKKNQYIPNRAFRLNFQNDTLKRVVFYSFPYHNDSSAENHIMDQSFFHFFLSRCSSVISFGIRCNQSPVFSYQISSVLTEIIGKCIPNRIQKLELKFPKTLMPPLGQHRFRQFSGIISSEFSRIIRESKIRVIDISFLLLFRRGNWFVFKDFPNLEEMKLGCGQLGKKIFVNGIKAKKNDKKKISGLGGLGFRDFGDIFPKVTTMIFSRAPCRLVSFISESLPNIRFFDNNIRRRCMPDYLQPNDRSIDLGMDLFEPIDNFDRDFDSFYELYSSNFVDLGNNYDKILSKFRRRKEVLFQNLLRKLYPSRTKSQEIMESFRRKSIDRWKLIDVKAATDQIIIDWEIYYNDRLLLEQKCSIRRREKLISDIITAMTISEQRKELVKNSIYIQTKSRDFDDIILCATIYSPLSDGGKFVVKYKHEGDLKRLTFDGNPLVVEIGKIGIEKIGRKFLKSDDLEEDFYFFARIMVIDFLRYLISPASLHSYCGDGGGVSESLGWLSRKDFLKIIIAVSGCGSQWGARKLIKSCNRHYKI